MTSEQTFQLNKKWQDDKNSRWLFLVAVVLIGGVSLWTEINDREGATLSLDPQTKTITLGETFKVDMILDTADGPIDGVDIYALNYDPAILEVVDDIPNQQGTQILPGTIIPTNAANIVEESIGMIKFSQINFGGTTFIGKGILATIHFKAIRTGAPYLKFDFSKGSTVDTNAAYAGKDQLARVIDANYIVK